MLNQNQIITAGIYIICFCCVYVTSCIKVYMAIKLGIELKKILYISASKQSQTMFLQQ